ncbi:transporter substrate-binding domain-containing protein [Variovorax sp. HW608]|uniref:transporter substrate-binding domain-containing protein n=1 Tax=Variovorax sp. HW608 TaxID=1034889 RepID=UPI000B5AE5B0|nr:transporter substrate-binding domain-containing protein [Variovorax sp. HW608]
MNRPAGCSVKARARPFALAVALAMSAMLALPAFCETSAKLSDRPLRVATKVIAPFVLPDTDPPAGFSIDLWAEVARRINVQYQWLVVSTVPELLQAVRAGDADVAVAAISITPEREELLDFSFPYFDSGLQIMVGAAHQGAILASLRSFPWLALGELFGFGSVLIFVMANVLMVIERRHANPNFRKPYWRAVGEGIWGIMLIFSTGEHGDRDTPRVWKRIAVAAMWFLGVLLIAQMTATVTAIQTVERLESSIRDINDLPGKKIASVAGTVAGDELTQRGLPFVPARDLGDAVRMLSHGDVVAVVYDSPTLQYLAATQASGAVQVVGPIFRPQKYGIAVAEGSALRKPINEALLKIYDDGTYDRLRAKWFSNRK